MSLLNYQLIYSNTSKDIVTDYSEIKLNFMELKLFTFLDELELIYKEENQLLLRLK